MKIHSLKVIPPYFDDLLCGSKKFEVRKNDCNFEVEDLLFLHEYQDGRYTGRKLIFIITYILPGGQFGIDPGYCVMSIKQVNFLKKFFDL